MLRKLAVLAAICLAPMGASADGPGLAAPPELQDSGLLKHILPRFSLKTGIRVTADDAGPMALADSAPGTPVFQGLGTVWHLRIDAGDPAQQRFLEWLTGDIGRRTVDSFQPDGTPVFTAAIKVEAEVAELEYDGDPVAGEKASLVHCGRCHVIGPQNAMNGIGSTPSFAVIKALPEWEYRFQAFYALRPHGAFTVIEDLTPAFDPERPPPIVPVEMTLDDLDDVMAYVATIPVADLGAAIQLQ